MYLGIYMKFLILKTNDPYRNLAIEEYLFTHCDDDIFMLWQNEPCIVIGKNQNAYAEINAQFVRENNIKLVRRITGGGAVYHDLGNVNYTFIGEKTEQGIDFAYFTQPIVSALASLGVKVSLTGRNDLVAETGEKISGNAQHSSGKRVLHHGTLLFSSDLDVLSCALKVDEEKIKSKAIKSARSRVTNISELIDADMTVSDFIAVLSDFLIRTYSPDIIDAPSGAEVDNLYAKYSSDEWLYPAGSYLSGYTVTKKKRYPFGTVELCLTMESSRIKKAKIFGDFFGIRPTEELEKMLENADITRLTEFLSSLNLGEYIHGMTSEDFITLVNY